MRSGGSTCCDRGGLWFTTTLSQEVSDDIEVRLCSYCQLPMCLPSSCLAAPSFVGEKYFCESGSTGPWEVQWYLDDPLWDSQGCASGGTCCDRGGPWFTTTLSQEVSDDIEVGLCLNQPSTDEDIGISQLEVFVY